MKLKLDIEEIRKALRVDNFTNEAAVCQGVVRRILHALSWPTYDTQVVSPEYSVEDGRVAFAPWSPRWKAALFIKVKGVGQCDAAGERQLFEYAFQKGFPMAILSSDHF
jgi:predicted type IV restriction endonuclease